MMDLKTKLAFALVSASLLSMAALGYFTYQWAEETFLADSQRRLSALADTKKSEIDGVVAQWKQELHDLVVRAQSSPLTRSGADSSGATTIDGIVRVLREEQASSDEKVENRSGTENLSVLHRADSYAEVCFASR